MADAGTYLSHLAQQNVVGERDRELLVHLGIHAETMIAVATTLTTHFGGDEVELGDERVLDPVDHDFAEEDRRAQLEHGEHFV